jgi:O-antigen/teichoic acid export membrane protein
LIFVHRKLKQPWWRSQASADDVKGLLSFGVWMTLTNIIGPLMVMADRFVISATLGAAVVAYYTVPFEALIRVLIIPAAVSATLFPRFASQFASDTGKAKLLYARSMKIVAVVLAPICLIICCGSYWGVRFWLGSDFAENSWVIVCIMSLGIFFNGMAFIPFATIQANGNPRTTAVLHLIELTFYLPLLLLALHYWGVVGAAAVWTLRVGVDLLCLIILTQKEFNVDFVPGN